MAISFIKNLKAKADKIRETIEEGSNTLRELREEVEGTVDKLKVDSEEKLMDTVTEIQESTKVFEEAGYELLGLRIEMGFNPKVVPRIRRVKDITDREFRSLMSKHEDREVVNALLKAIRKAEELEDKVSLSDHSLELCNFEIEVGVVPAVHVTWAKPEPETAPVTTESPATTEEIEPEEPASRFGASSFTSSSFSSSYTPPKYQSTSSSYSSPSSATSSKPEEEAEPAGNDVPEEQPVVAVAEKPIAEEEPKPVVEEADGLDRWIKFPEIK
ncbi:MAG: hypothetical protein QF685_09985 [Verrucomicrobiota bacterium]|jgi:hypothetical protein|nr:hypothetical protein [Verrucomicrobiota bacterium]